MELLDQYRYLANGNCVVADVCRHNIGGQTEELCLGRLRHVSPPRWLSPSYPISRPHKHARHMLGSGRGLKSVGLLVRRHVTAIAHPAKHVRHLGMRNGFSAVID